MMKPALSSFISVASCASAGDARKAKDITRDIRPGSVMRAEVIAGLHRYPFGRTLVGGAARVKALHRARLRRRRLVS
jgi:hypothetical protein